jgi:competence protein ComEC
LPCAIVKHDSFKERGLMMRSRGLIYVGLGLAALMVWPGCAEKDESIAEPDTVPPVIADIAETDGRVAWTTDEDCTCVLLCGTSQGVYRHYGYNVYDGGMAHYVDLIDVDPGQYYFKVIATDLFGNVTTSEEVAFEIDVVPETDNMELTMVDVGWGDCHFLIFPSGTTVMVDAGNGDDPDYPHTADVFAFLNAKGISGPSGIDYMIATHSHADHYRGFLSLISLYDEAVFLGPAGAFYPVWEVLGEDLDESGVARDSLSEGQTNETTEFLKWDEEHGVDVRILSAGAGTAYQSGDWDDRVNCDSPVIRITYGMVDIMLNGDAEDFVEQRMVKTYGNQLDCEILKVGHHANDDASSEEFIRLATPRVGLVPNSLEENDGVFDQTTINLLREYKVDYYVSDRAYRNAGRYDEPLDGNVTVTTDGESFIVHSWK